MDELKRIIAELDELGQTVGEPLGVTCRRRVDLLDEGFRLLAGAILELNQHED